MADRSDGRRWRRAPAHAESDANDEVVRTASAQPGCTAIAATSASLRRTPRPPVPRRCAGFARRHRQTCRCEGQGGRVALALRRGRAALHRAGRSPPDGRCAGSGRPAAAGKIADIFTLARHRGWSGGKILPLCELEILAEHRLGRESLNRGEWLATAKSCCTVAGSLEHYVHRRQFDLVQSQLRGLLQCRQGQHARRCRDHPRTPRSRLQSDGAGDGAGGVEAQPRRTGRWR